MCFQAGGLQVASRCRCSARPQTRLSLKTTTSRPPHHMFSTLSKNDRGWKDCVAAGNSSISCANLFLLLFVTSCFYFVWVSLDVLKPLNDPNILGRRRLVSLHYAWSVNNYVWNSQVITTTAATISHSEIIQHLPIQTKGDREGSTHFSRAHRCWRAPRHVLQVSLSLTVNTSEETSKPCSMTLIHIVLLCDGM